MDIVTKVDLTHNPLSLKDYRHSLIRVLDHLADDAGVFAESRALLGYGDFEEWFETKEEAEQHHRELIDHFYAATGKKFLGEIGGKDVSHDNYTPDPNLPEKEYREALNRVIFDAQCGAWEADDWDLFTTDQDYKLRLTYAEFLSYNAGANAWANWLEDVVDLAGDEGAEGSEGSEDDEDDEDDEATVFMKEAMKFYTDDFLQSVTELRVPLKETWDAIERDKEKNKKTE